MANSTTTYWDINGVSLQTYAFNISTWGGDLHSPPPLRGEDLTIPYRPGQVFQQRRPDGRSMTFNMWVQGSDENGAVPTTKTQRMEFEKNFKVLRGLFWGQGKQVLLTKRWIDYTTGNVVSATAKAVFAGGITPTMTGDRRATFQVEMFLSDPFFYGAEVTLPTFAATTTSNQTVTILGDYETNDIIIDFNGARNNMRMTNTSEAVYVNVNQNLGAGSLIRVDVTNFTARLNPSGANTNVLGSVSQFGHPFMFVLRPGTQNLSLTSSSGSGTAVIKYLPRYF